MSRRPFRARWCDLAGVSAEWLALHVAKLALSWRAARRMGSAIPTS
ncbi:hypothetical protein JMJ56_16830 [Belnapia sp. T18]|uniref:Transposase DDE domain-containing protein n=1 Tax=Belnapia arida TaxID=2804533 RepID=A0ABS1U4S9_9PROT|nr:hypothetical protein [Belnapia arida]MBL6079685.1 hypothetical protein [Belnapia arida]